MFDSDLFIVQFSGISFFFVHIKTVKCKDNALVSFFFIYTSNRIRNRFLKNMKFEQNNSLQLIPTHSIVVAIFKKNETFYPLFSLFFMFSFNEPNI